jgi:hypothetical protein
MKRIPTFALAFFTSAIAFAAQAAEVRNIVIVHGALADGSGCFMRLALATHGLSNDPRHIPTPRAFALAWSAHTGRRCT